MPLSAVDYSKIVIYRIFSNSHEFVYVGSTCNFRARKNQHKTCCNNPNNPKYDLKLYSTIRENGGWENYKMLEIEKFPCDDKNECRAREQHWIDFYKPQLNTRKAFGCETKQEYHKQYYIEHVEEKKQYDKKYCIEHAEEIKKKQAQPIHCSCGSTVRKSDILQHNRTKKHIAFIEKSNPAPNSDDNIDSNSQNSTCSFL